jgi:hypothetical protein
MSTMNSHVRRLRNVVPTWAASFAGSIRKHWSQGALRGAAGFRIRCPPHQQARRGPLPTACQQQPAPDVWHGGQARTPQCSEGPSRIPRHVRVARCRVASHARAGSGRRKRDRQGGCRARYMSSSPEGARWRPSPPIGITSEVSGTRELLRARPGGSRRPGIEGGRPSPRVGHPGRVAPAGFDSLSMLVTSGRQGRRAPV